MAAWTDWIMSLVSDVFSGTYSDPGETTEDDEYVTEYVTQVRYLGPIYEHRYMLVSDMPKFFDDEELNQAYHSKAEYVNSLEKYGYIFKTQKFENADTVEKLAEYASDWIKNNYYGTLTSLDVTALDLHLVGENVNPYMDGEQVDVYYPDPDTGEEVLKTLTVLSAEYDLYNPDKDKYKIGVPDTTLNKTYGETTKSGGGGGGGGKNASDNGTDDGTELEGTEDKLAALIEQLTGSNFSLLTKELKDKAGEVVENLVPAGMKDITSKFKFTWTPDELIATVVNSTNAVFSNRVTAKYQEVRNALNVGGKIDLPNMKLDGTGIDITNGPTLNSSGLDVGNVSVGKTSISIGGETLNSQSLHDLLELIR